MEIDIYKRNDIIHVKPDGKLIGSASAELRRKIYHFLSDDDEAPKFLIDFADVTLVDSSSLGALMEAHISITKQGGRIAVINVSKHIKSLIVRSRLINTFEHFESENEAVSALQSQAN
jgi:anti-sigma B factor antagonist